MRLAYLINQYPKISHSFIRREIAAMETLGCDVARIAIRASSTDLADPADLEEVSRTHGVLAQGPLRLAADAMAEALRAPIRFARTMALALALGGRSERGRLLHLVYLVEAAHVARHLRALGTQHMHAHFGTNSATVALLAAKLAGIRWSFTVHGPEEFDSPRALSLDEKIAHAAFVIAISHYGSSQLMRWSCFETWDRITVVRCALNLAAFDAAATTPQPEAPRLVCVGRLTEQKGQILLLNAAAEIAKETPDFRLDLVGDGEMRSAIEQRISDLRLEETVQITGWADEVEVRRRISSARALVLGSFAEGLPVVIMEAFALRRPVIATWVAGIPELVDGACGWLVPAGDVAALAGAMREALTASPDSLAAMGREGRRRVEAHHDQMSEASKLLSLFRRAAQIEG